MSFFTVTPLGPMLNCFSRQQDQIDETLPDALHMAGIYLCILGTSVGVIISVLPYFSLCVVVLILLCVGLQRFTAALSQYLKQRIDATNPKIFSHFAETLHGISVVRAFRAEDRFRDVNLELVNKNHQMVFHMDQLNCWTAFYVDLVASLSVLGTSLLCVAFRDTLTSAAAGLAISNVLQMLVFLNMMVKAFNEARSQTVAVQCTLHYIKNTQSEKKNGKVKLVYQDWPPSGKIKFQDAVMSYFPDSAPVLKGVSFTIQPGEKIGIVGRTGSGKSSLIMALFRLVELSKGSIYIDGLDISRLGLAQLRSSLSIIPQDPVMFKGTLKSNLDPFEEFEDEELWAALRTCRLDREVASYPLGLLHPVDENGCNISLGQKQMFCLVRAVLRGSPILVLDEATASLDLATDSLIQSTIREVFRDRTILTIAHRIETILDYDKILYLDDGKVLEFENTQTLLQNPDSHFSKLIKG